MTVIGLMAAPKIQLKSRGHGPEPMPPFKQWTNLRAHGIKYHLTTNQKYVRKYMHPEAREMVMKQTNSLYPAPPKILEVVKKDLWPSMKLSLTFVSS
eukprot:Em0004g430a